MLLFALLLGCNDISVKQIAHPSIIVAPDSLNFGHLLSGHESSTKTVTITNGGTADLIVDHLEISGDNYSADLSGFVVPSGGWHQIDVSYTPKTFEHNEGYLDIYLQGENSPSEGVWLDGNGDAAVINVTPSDHDFGAPLLGCDSTIEIIIQNDGNVDLQISDIDVMASVPPDITIDFGTLPAFPWTIAPSGRLAFFANYVPLDEDNDETIFEIHSSDPQTPLFEGSAIGAAVLDNETTQSWVQRSKIIVDILWVIDNSGSMMHYQNLLGSNMHIFMNMFMSYSPDFRIAFITTDSPFFVDGEVIDSNHPDPIGAAVGIVNSIGVLGSGWEQGLGMLDLCLIGDCVGFLREDATFITIFMSDEADMGATSPIALASFIDTIKPDMFIPYGIIGPVPSGCMVHPFYAVPGWGYYELIQNYNSQYWSICENDWGNQLEELAQNISIQTVFPLDAEDPHVETIEVWINGQLTTEGWSYSEESNAVVFDVEGAPDPGDSIDISYSTWGCGPQ